MVKTYFNPSCAMSLYKPHMESIFSDIFNSSDSFNSLYGKTELHKICCFHEPKLEAGALIINVCPGCDARFDELYEGVSTISIWEIMDTISDFNFPDYNGLKMAVHDACPVREKPQVHDAVRSLLKKMNIEVIEPSLTRESSVCCGDSLYPALSLDKVHAQMKERASSMPCDNVCVYCVSCVKAMHIGGKKPYFLPDLLLKEDTDTKVCDTALWHEQIDEYRDRH